MLLTGSEFQQFRRSQEEYRKLIEVLKDYKKQAFTFRKSPSMIPLEKLKLKWVEEESHWVKEK